MSFVSRRDDFCQYLQANFIPYDNANLTALYGHCVTPLGIIVVEFPLFK